MAEPWLFLLQPSFFDYHYVMRKIAIIGGGASGIYAALFLRQKHPKDEITIFEAGAKPAKRFYATGNGHCNLLNENLDPGCYKDPQWAKEIFDRHDYKSMLEQLSSLGVQTFSKGALLYPLSYSARTYIDYLLSLLERLGVKIETNARLIDYQAEIGGGYGLFFNNAGKRNADCVVFATGGCASPKYSDGSDVLSLLKRRGYKIEAPLPGLTGLRVKGIAELEGVRHEALVRLKLDESALYEERGEVQFKKDGLSGIAIMNAESVLSRQRITKAASLTLDLFPDITIDDLAKRLYEAKSLSPSFLEAFVEKKLAAFFHRRLDRSDTYAMAKAMKEFVLSVAGTYGFENSQIMIGGVKKDDVSASTLESKREKGVFFLGEMLDNDGLCGGYNLSWCLATALAIVDSL